MIIESANGKVTADVKHWTVQLSGDGIGDRKMLGSRGRIAVVAISNDGAYVGIAPYHERSVLIYQWNGHRWQTSFDWELPQMALNLAWNEDAGAGNQPDLLVTLQDGSTHRYRNGDGLWRVVQ